MANVFENFFCIRCLKKIKVTLRVYYNDENLGVNFACNPLLILVFHVESYLPLTIQ